jgi:putative endonuclease
MFESGRRVCGSHGAIETVHRPESHVTLDSRARAPAVISTGGRNLSYSARLALRNAARVMPDDRHYYVYVLTNWNNRVIYIGVTNDLERRVFEHKNKLVKGFTEKYNVNKLVYFEETSDVNAALTREKEIKKWRREKKDALVTNSNPQWTELKIL